MPRPARISVVDDDESIRESFPALLCGLGFAVETFASAQAFLDAGAADRSDCLILDIAMPDMSGPALESELLSRGYTLPIVFITAHADELERLAHLANGAMDSLLKPFTEAALMRAIHAALVRKPQR